MSDVEAWLGNFAETIGQRPPDAQTIDRVLRLASVAAHGSARQAAPVACWLAGTVGMDLDDAIAVAERLAGHGGEPRS